MGMTNKNLKLQISDLEHRIDRASIEFEDDTKEIKDFRQRVFFVHYLIEQRMSLMIIDKLLERLTPESIRKNLKLTEKDLVQWSEFMGDIAEYLIKLEYLPKLKLAQAVGAMRGELLAKAKELNRLRNAMGHTRDRKYKKYLERKKVLEALKMMVWLIEKTEDTMPFFDALDEDLKKRAEIEDDEIPF